MTLDDMKILLAGRLGQRTDIDDMIYNEIRQAQRVLEKTPPYPWFLMLARTFDYAIRSNPLPDDFIEMYEDILWLVRATADTTRYPIPVKVYGSELEHMQGGQDVLGRPRNFFLAGDPNYLVLVPTPDVSYQFLLVYYKKDTELTGPSSENIWSTRAEDLLVAEAGWHVARNIRDNEAATLFGQDRAEARRRIAQETTSRRESMRRAVIGSGEDALLGQSTWEMGHQ